MSWRVFTSKTFPNLAPKCHFILLDRFVHGPDFIRLVGSHTGRDLSYCESHAPFGCPWPRLPRIEDLLTHGHIDLGHFRKTLPDSTNSWSDAEDGCKASDRSWQLSPLWSLTWQHVIFDASYMRCIRVCPRMHTTCQNRRSSK